MAVLIGCVKCEQRGGRGSKIPKNLRTYLMDGPLAFLPPDYQGVKDREGEAVFPQNCQAVRKV